MKRLLGLTALLVFLAVVAAPVTRAFDWPQQGARGVLRFERELPFPSPVQSCAFELGNDGRVKTLSAVSDNRALFLRGGRLQQVAGRKGQATEPFLRHSFADYSQTTAVQVIPRYAKDGWDEAELALFDPAGRPVLEGVRIPGNRELAPSPDGQYVHLLPGSFAMNWAPTTVFRGNKVKTWVIGEAPDQWPGGNQLGVRFSRDGGRYAVLTEAGGTERAHVFDRQGRRLYDAQMGGLVRLSPNGRVLAAVSAGNVTVLTEDGRDRRVVAVGDVATPTELLFSADDKVVAVGDHSGNVQLVDTGRANVKWHLQPGDLCPSTSTVSCKLLGLAGDEGLRRLVAATASWRWKVTEYLDGKPWGRVQDADHDYVVLFGTDGQPLDSFVLPPGWMASRDAFRKAVSVSPNGKYIAVAVSAGVGIYSIRQ